MSDSMHADILQAQNGIYVIYQKRKLMIEAICRQFAAMALNKFLAEQPNEQLKKGFWTNRTLTARNTVFAGTEAEDLFVGFFLAHGVEYGIKLEIGNDRRFEALRPIIYSFYDQFVSVLNEVFGDDK